MNFGKNFFNEIPDIFHLFFCLMMKIFQTFLARDYF